jgi:hypothetical protein
MPLKNPNSIPLRQTFYTLTDIIPTTKQEFTRKKKRLNKFLSVFWQTKSLISQSSVNQRNLLYWFHKLLGTRKITPCSHRCTGSETSLASPNFFLGLLYTQTYPASILLILDKGKMGHPLTLAYNSKKCYQSITNSPLYVTCSTLLHFCLWTWEHIFHSSSPSQLISKSKTLWQC